MPCHAIPHHTLPTQLNSIFIDDIILVMAVIVIVIVITTRTVLVVIIVIAFLIKSISSRSIYLLAWEDGGGEGTPVQGRGGKREEGNGKS